MAGLPCGCYSRPAGLLRRRGGICAPGAVPALGRIACAGTSRLRRLSAGNGAVQDAGARGAPRGAGGQLSSSPWRRSPRAHNPSAEPGDARESEGTGSPAPRLVSTTPSGALKGREKGGGLRAAWGPASSSTAGARALCTPSKPGSASRLLAKPQS